MKTTKYITASFLLFLSISAKAQTNIIPVSVPFLAVTPDARAAGMGEIGVATTPSAYSSYWNMGKAPFSDNSGEISLSYSPYFRLLAPGMDFINLSGYFKNDYNTTIGYYAKYLSMGETIYRDDNGIEYGLKRPFDFTVGGSYSLRISEGTGIGIGAKYINSSVSTFDTENRPKLKSSHGISFDLGFYHQVFFNSTKVSYGATMNNIGTKINYSSSKGTFQPMNLKLGGAVNLLAGVNGSFTVGVDVTKPLTPTPPIIEDEQIVSGQSMDKSIIKSIYSSFTDAPDGFSETLQGLTYGLGFEYEYMQQVFVRGGFVYENQNKGEKRYGTLGAGFKYHNFSLDGSYFLPIDQSSLFKNAAKISITFTLE